MQQYPHLSQCPKCLKHNPQIKKSCYFCSNSLEANTATASTHDLSSPSFTPLQAQQSVPVKVDKTMPAAQVLLRLIAAGIDLSISLALFLFLWFALIDDSHLGLLAAALLLSFYLPALMDAFSASFGKRLFDLGVLRPDGSKPGVLKMLLRQTLKFLPDLFMPLFLRILFFVLLKEQHLHDWICKTEVVADYKNRIKMDPENKLYHEKLLSEQNQK